MDKIKRSIRLSSQSNGKYRRVRDLHRPPYFLKANQTVREICAPDTPGSSSVFVEIVGDDIYNSKLWLKRLPCEPTILDVGSNYGLFSCWIKIRFPRASVTAIEPQPDMLRFLESNAKAFDFKVIPKAVAEDNKPVLMNTSGDPTTSFVIDFPDSTEPQLSPNTTVVESISWQEVFHGNTGMIDLLKCDCEGGERLLLNNLSLLKKSRIIVMEYHFTHVDQAWVLDRFNNAGFTILSNSVGPYSGHLIAAQE
ncbi:FkbM family methyltransferase [Synechococcus sp. CBW1108]|uniref:FkbM family methyltransferase n=1 Tax=Synechococcus sp. CBW1108 TaxID=1353147 RepID=UPI0018CE8E0D|nr:FkbM family methyltransferase [Synechococcus sp. CBW1108]QPN70341.1 FkbM family methyltransferase [Synechococcus sp. CBW1108]